MLLDVPLRSQEPHRIDRTDFQKQRDLWSFRKALIRKAGEINNRIASPILRRALVSSFILFSTRVASSKRNANRQLRAAFCILNFAAVSD